MAAVLGGFLWFVTTITPYQPPQQQAVFYWADDHAVDRGTYQRVRVTQVEQKYVQGELIDGDNKGVVATVRTGSQLERHQLLQQGDIIIVTESVSDGKRGALSYVDTMRLPALAVLLAVFIVCVVFVSGRQGALSVVGLILSILVIGWLIVPLILSGYDPLFVSLVGSYIIAVVSVLVSHGWCKRTFIAIACIVGVLTLVACLAWLVTIVASLSGIADEVNYYLLQSNEHLNMRGIVTGGIVIAALGVLDDVVTTQVATVDELHNTDKRQTRKQLFKSAASVGSEHVASLVNTLALAYVGASLPFVVMLASQSVMPPILMLNGEYIATEIIRTLVASIGLVVAVPLSTAVAAAVYKRSATMRV